MAIDSSTGYSLGDFPAGPGDHAGGEHELQPPAQSPDEARERLGRKLWDWWYQARTLQAENRLEMAVDDDFIDGLQWTEEEELELINRGQTPLVFNEILPAIQWVLGTERRTRIDWRVLPRAEDDVAGAAVKTEVIKYLSDANRAPWARSQAFKDAVGPGLGWIEVGLRKDPEDEPIFVRRESWRNIWFDPMSVEPDLSDARYLFRSRIMDLDLAQAMFPRHMEALRQESVAFERTPYDDEDVIWNLQLYYDRGGYARSASSLVDDALAVNHHRRVAVRLIECWYRQPTAVKVFYKSGDFEGAIYDPGNDDMRVAALSEPSSLYDAIRLQVRVAMITNSRAILSDSPSPYRHNRFPFVPVWGHRRARDNMPYGIVRNARDPQRDMNKRRVNALYRLATKRTIMEEGAVDDLDVYLDEVARPDAVIVKKPNRELVIEENIPVARQDIELAQQDGEYIRQISGVTAENLGRESNAQSGRAVLARQNQGTLTTAVLFDHYRLANQLAGEILLSLVEQTWTGPRTIRLTGKRRAAFEYINWPALEGGIINDITESQADFQISEQDFRENVRQAMWEQMNNMLSTLPPEIAIQLLDLVFEMTDIPNKDEMIERIRRITGQQDPDDPEHDLKQAQSEQARAEQQGREQRMMEAQQLAQVKKLISDIERNQAQARAANAGALNTTLGARRQAVESGAQMLTDPDAATVSDALMNESNNA